MSPKRAPGRPPELPGYSYERLLGSGGFADVYLYTQLMPRRPVAVKVLTAEALREQTPEQLLAEADLMARLSSHPSIVGVHDAGRARDGRPYLVMQYCPLPSLAERVKARPLGVPEALSIGVRLAGAVETAHRAGIVHRDIKPANVLTTEYGRPALTDFGIAGAAGEAASDGAGVSVPWAPPEALDGEGTGGVAGDVYSLGATIYTLLAGRAPFHRPAGPNTRLDHMTRIRRDPVPPLDRADVPRSLEAVLARAMAKQPARRYASALDLARALQAVEQELRLAMTDVEVPDTSWMAAAPPAEAAARTVVHGVVTVDPAGADSTRTRAVRTADGDLDRRPDATVPAGAAGTVRPADEGPTVRRPTTGPETTAGRHTASPPRRRGRVLVAAGVVAAVLLGGVVGAGALRGDPGSEPTTPAGTAIPIPERVAAPVGLSGARDGDTVAFTWQAPAEHAGATGLSYTWQRAEPGAEQQVHVAREPGVILDDAAGQVCLAVKVRLPNGTTSTEPAVACVP
ncbi:serine/threonine-protein kinase [Georgenia thermotolerans]|uniref:non-specific serine/threonine protein kinase n=1 Tax=Georgenia thermotolerans TaxID=527326 RepID=A0A7J5UQ48_9MICO|nr:serine/threonine-protein kinase [Georgenia thermotolerans]KAE8764532.1 protein kinase [Georgenia thermotolerans]